MFFKILIKQLEKCQLYFLHLIFLRVAEAVNKVTEEILRQIFLWIVNTGRYNELLQCCDAFFYIIKSLSLLLIGSWHDNRAIFEAFWVHVDPAFQTQTQ